MNNTKVVFVAFAFSQLHCSVRFFEWNERFAASNPRTLAREVHGPILDLPPGWEPLSYHATLTGRDIFAKKWEWR